MTLVLSRGSRFFRQCSRKFSSSCIRENSQREARVMNKLFSSKMERKLQGSVSAPYAVKILDKNRLAMLNKMYMTNITEVLVCGGFDGIFEKGIEITRVLVKDTGNVHVFWISNADEDDFEVQNFLNSIAGEVAHKLQHANMMGCTPRITFKHDLSAINVQVTQKLLEKVAFENSLHEKVSSWPQESEKTEESEESEISEPNIQMDVLGLPYDKILRRIKEARAKHHPTHIPKPPTSEEFQQSVDARSTESSDKALINQQKLKKDLKKFISTYKGMAPSPKRCVEERGLPTAPCEEYEESEFEDLRYDPSFNDDDWEEENRK